MMAITTSSSTSVKPRRAGEEVSMRVIAAGRDATIPAIPRGTARRGRQYAFGGYAIAWPAQVIAPRGFVRFEHPLGIGGFPSGRYALSVEYATTHRLEVLQSQVVFFDVP